MTYRLYYWFQGAPADRPGGPWWYRDFENGGERNFFLLLCKPFLYRWAEAHGESGTMPNHDLMEIQPPEELTLFGRAGGGWGGHIMHYHTVVVERA